MNEDTVRETAWAVVGLLYDPAVVFDDRTHQMILDLRAALSAVPEGAAHVHDWHERQQGAGRYCPGCDTMEWFAVPSPEPLDVERLARAVAAVYVPLDTVVAVIAAEYARLAAPQPVQEEL